MNDFLVEKKKGYLNRHETGDFSGLHFRLFFLRNPETFIFGSGNAIIRDGPAST